MSADEPDRRVFLKVATCAVGGGIGLVVAAPVLRFVVDPAGRQTVSTTTDPVDVGGVDQLVVGAPWRKVDVIAPVVRDAWLVAHDVVLGAAWLRRPTTDGGILALSAVCPHLGCAVGWDPTASTFLCPCHSSHWDASGALVDGKAKRDLDPLPIEVKDGRLRLTWVTYKLDTPVREPA